MLSVSLPFLALDCKQKKSRSRSGSKKKMLTLPHGADEVYILRCRYMPILPNLLFLRIFVLRHISYYIWDFPFVAGGTFSTIKLL